MGSASTAGNPGEESTRHAFGAAGSAADWLSSAAVSLQERVSGELLRPLVRSFAVARSGLFFSESLPLLALQRVLGASGSAEKRPPAAAREAVLRALSELFRRDAEHIAAGDYPLTVLAPETGPLEHAFRYLRLLADSIRVAGRKRARQPREFGEQAARLANELPDYYRRNFHFQTDGYLSEASADLYEHQVEILFRGAADAMRRSVIPALRRQLGTDDGRGLRLLELGAGCGSTTRFVARALPEATITCLDLSHPYLLAARRRLTDFPRIGFMQGDAAELDLRDSCFDAVYSVFLFHELPAAVRKRVLDESHRVLKPGGALVVLDSLQRHDVPELDWALDEFPKQFHEPYFRNYTRTPLETMVTEAGFEPPHSDPVFLSKLVVSKPMRAERTAPSET